MKRIVLIILVIATGYAGSVQAQTGKKISKQQTAKKKSTAKKATTQAATVKTGTVTLTSSSTNKAYNHAAAVRFSIADPTINALNQRAAGNNVPVSSSGIVGMPKRTYGFANGKILLRNTTATTPGTSYGSGAVGSGTTILGVGTSENAIGVNGKNPYAGPWLWGSKVLGRPLQLSDSARRNE